MESHAHHIHKAPGKGWKHYFFEFLMLFLAVFCGFLAENIREHEVERRKEKQYMKSLWSDLQADTSSLREISRRFTDSRKRIDMLIRLLKGGHRNDSTCQIYKLAMSIPLADKVPQPNNKTFEQLKSSGNLRLIHNNDLLDSIGAYYNRYDQLMTGGPGQMLFQNRHDLYLFTYELFDMEVFHRFLQSGSDPFASAYVDSCTTKPALLTNDPIVINKICARYYYIEMTRKVLLEAWIERFFFPQADALLAKLEEEYHFKN